MFIKRVQPFHILLDSWSKFCLKFWVKIFENYIFGITFLMSKVIFETWNFVKMNPKFINREDQPQRTLN